jgi:hypothetical protein
MLLHKEITRHVKITLTFKIADYYETYLLFVPERQNESYF